jgi:hypothetical protein
MVDHGKSLLEKLLSCFHISFLTERENPPEGNHAAGATTADIP